MTDKQIKKYCEGLCALCDEFGIYNEEPCIYKIANELEEKLLRKEQECEELKQWKKGAESLFKAQIDNTDKIINQYKQALDEMKKIAKEQVPYLNIGEAKTMIEIEYNYAGAICNLEQRIHKILQKISECEEVITKIWT